MTKFIPILVFMHIWSGHLYAQLWKPTEVKPMPESVSNNAVCDGFIGDTPYVFSFSGIDSTKIWSGIHLKSWRYNVPENSWEAIAPLPDPYGGKIAAAASRIGDTIFIMGGYHVAQNGSETSSHKVHRYQVSTNSYLTDGMDIPVAVDDHVQAVWRDSLIYIVTGWSNNTNVPNVQIYNPSSDTWMAGTPVPNNNFYKAFGAGGTILCDTIFYYGGAALGSSFPAQYRLRKGVINPENPAEITWSVSSLFGVSNKGYRMAAFGHMGSVHWIGGSGITYNFDGIAYNGSGGVAPVNRNLYLNTSNSSWDTSLTYQYPMDLRGIANIAPGTKFLAGGMTSGQAVANKTYRLDWEEELITISASPILQNTSIKIFPNPASDKINIEIDINDSSSKIIHLLSVSGEALATLTLNNGINKIDIRRYGSGLYILKVIIDNTVFSHKLIIK